MILTRIKWLAFILTVMALAGCSGLLKEGAPLQSTTAKKIMNPGMYTPKVDTFHVILDASNSMDHVPNAYRKYDLAVNILDRMNQLLPEYDMAAGLRSFGHHPGLSQESTRLFYGIAPYNTAEFGQSLHQIKPPGGTSPLHKAFEAAVKDLGDTPGKTAIIVVSDGKKMNQKVLQAARKLADTYGDSLCIYPILIGDDEKGKLLMETIAGLTHCGVMTRGRDLVDNIALKKFVHKVFLDKSAMPKPGPKRVDSDGDGVIDKWDNCPDTPSGAAVDSNGCEQKPELNDSDGDGVIDIKDNCPGTPEGARVGINGCWNVGNVFFGFDRSEIGPKGKIELLQVKEILEQNPDLRVTLQGHTCDIGTRAYNLGLSNRRAEAVKNYLMEQGISGHRLETEGVGFSMPLVPNTSEENRAMNRRTEIHPID